MRKGNIAEFAKRDARDAGRECVGIVRRECTENAEWDCARNAERKCAEHSPVPPTPLHRHSDAKGGRIQ